MTTELAMQAAITSLTGAVVVLFGLFVKNNKDMQAILRLRDKQREGDREKIAVLERLAGWIRFCPVPDCPARRQDKEAGPCDDESNANFSIAGRCRKTKHQP